MLLICCQTAILAQNTEGGIQFIHDNYNEAIAKAKSEKKIIFLDAYTTWCGPCKMMSKLTFTVPEVGSFFNKNFVNLKFDMEKGDGPMLQQKFDVVAYPTLLFIDSSGKLVHIDNIDHSTPKPSLASIIAGRKLYQDQYSGG